MKEYFDIWQMLRIVGFIHPDIVWIKLSSEYAKAYRDFDFTEHKQREGIRIMVCVDSYEDKENVLRIERNISAAYNRVYPGKREYEYMFITQKEYDSEVDDALLSLGKGSPRKWWIYMARTRGRYEYNRGLEIPFKTILGRSIDVYNFIMNEADKEFDITESDKERFIRHKEEIINNTYLIDEAYDAWAKKRIAERDKKQDE